MGDIGALAALPPRSMAASVNPGLEAGVHICRSQALKTWAEALAGIFVPHPLNAAPAGLSSERRSVPEYSPPDTKPFSA